jgi:Ca2+/Na+ antiporter
MGIVAVFLSFLGVARLAGTFGMVWPPLAAVVLVAFLITIVARLLSPRRGLRAPRRLYQDLSDLGRPLWQQTITFVRLIVIVVIWVVLGVLVSAAIIEVTLPLGLTDTNLGLVVFLGTFFGVPIAGSVLTNRWLHRHDLA